MPRYDMGCDDCNHTYDEFIPIDGIDHKLHRCPKCGSQHVRRIWKTAPKVIIRPEGWNLRPGEPGYGDLKPKVDRYSWQSS